MTVRARLAALVATAPRPRATALFGLAQSLRARGAPAVEIAKTELRFARAWRWADTPLTLDLLL